MLRVTLYVIFCNMRSIEAEFKLIYLILIVPQPEAPVIDPLWLVAPDHHFCHGDGGRHPKNQAYSASLENAPFLSCVCIFLAPNIWFLTKGAARNAAAIDLPRLRPTRGPMMLAPNMLDI